MTAALADQGFHPGFSAAGVVRRFRKGATIALTCALLAAMGASDILRAPAAAAPKVPVTKEMRMQIPTMSTGLHQSLLNSGTNAKVRNAEIPLAGGPIADMRGFNSIPLNAPQYGTALRCLTQAVYYEAANEPELGKRAVAQVVLNRLKHPAYPNSVCSVVYEGANARVCQFSFTCDGSLLRAPMARQWSESQRVAQEALAGTVVSEVGSATHYHADYVLPRWAFTLGKLRKIGAHIFYRFPGRVGSAPSFADNWSGVERIPALDLERLRRNLDAQGDLTAEPEAAFVPGLTVAADVKDRHATNDVGGRLNTTTTWRLSIPEPTQLSASYSSAMSEQGDIAPEGASESPTGMDQLAGR